mmetsp:Transcript_13890/g.56315  ORF Transcript_13890/g.56315 Transcript_13890/m.56315 type:complete len:238 (-) Transcript_13890:3822-4535(-)
MKNSHSSRGVMSLHGLRPPGNLASSRLRTSVCPCLALRAGLRRLPSLFIFCALCGAVCALSVNDASKPRGGEGGERRAYARLVPFLDDRRKSHRAVCGHVAVWTYPLRSFGSYHRWRGGGGRLVLDCTMLVRLGRHRARSGPPPFPVHEAKRFSGFRVFMKYLVHVVILGCLLGFAGATATAVVVVFIRIAFVWIDGDHFIAVYFDSIVVIDVLFRNSDLFEFTARIFSYVNSTLLQ